MPSIIYALGPIRIRIPPRGYRRIHLLPTPRKGRPTRPIQHPGRPHLVPPALAILSCTCHFFLAGSLRTNRLNYDTSDLLLVLWPMFFIVTSRQRPHLKVRNWGKSVVKGTTHARTVASSVASSFGPPLVRTHPRRKEDGDLNMLEEAEDRPAWDTAIGNVSAG